MQPPRCQLLDAAISLEDLNRQRNNWIVRNALETEPVPHHLAYGSVHGGSVDYAAGAPAREARRRVPRKSSFESAMASAGLLLIRQGP